MNIIDLQPSKDNTFNTIISEYNLLPCSVTNSKTSKKENTNTMCNFYKNEITGCINNQSNLSIENKKYCTTVINQFSYFYCKF